MTRVNPPVIHNAPGHDPRVERHPFHRLRNYAFKSAVRSLSIVAILVATSITVSGQTINVSNSTDYNNAIQTIDGNPNSNYTLNFVNGFTMSQPVSDFHSNASITLAGNSNTIDGANLYQPLVVDSGSVTLQSLNVVNSGSPITVNGGTLVDTTGVLQGPITNDGAVRFNLPSTATYNYGGNMTGTGSVEIAGAGTVTFSGVNGYTGGTTVDSGATLVGTTQSLTGPITDNWLVKFDQSTNGTFAGVISGSGTVEIANTGIVTLSGANNYSGGTLVDFGATLNTSINSIGGSLIDIGTVNFNQSADGTYAGVIVGTGLLQFGGGGTVTLTGLNNFSGRTVIDHGSALVGSTSSLTGSMGDNGLVKFNQSTLGTFAGNIDGTGSVEIAGGGSIFFSGKNTYTGGTLVDANTGLGGTTSSLQGDIVNNGFVRFIQATDGTYSGKMSGAGEVEISGPGPVLFTGVNSYNGGTIIDSGSTLAGSATSLHGAIYDSGTLQFSLASSSAFNGTISGTGRVEVKDNVAVTLTGTNNYSGGTTVGSNATLIGDTSSIQGNIFNNGTVQFNVPAQPTVVFYPIVVLDSILQASPNIAFPAHQVFPSSIYSGVMSGTGGAKVTGGGSIIFTGANNYTGGTTVDTATTLIGSTTSLQGNISNNGTVQFVTTGTGNYAGNMTGTGNVHLSGGTISFSGANGYSGGTIVDQNTTLIGTTFGVQGDITNQGLVQFMQSGGTFSGMMSGSGSVEIGGGSQVTFSGSNSYSGGTTIDAGSTLIGTTLSLQGAVTDNGLLKFNQTTAGHFQGVISGTGGVEISGAGPITINTVNNYTGGTTVDDGSTLIIGANGALAGKTTVNAGGTLSGRGILGDVTVNAGGTIFPNSPSRPLTPTQQSPGQVQSFAIPVSLYPTQISGNFTQGTGSKYSVELTPSGENDKLNITGTAQIKNGTVLNLALDPGTMTVGTKYNVLSAAGGLSGAYSFVSTSATSQNIAFTEQYDPHNLNVTVNSNLAPSAQTDNQFSLASAIDRSSGSATGDYATAVTQLTTLGAGPLSHALNQISGDIYPSLTSVQRQTSTAQMQLLSNRLASLTANGPPPSGVTQKDRNIRFVSSQGGATQSADDSAASANRDPWGLTGWVQGYGLGGNIAGDGNAGGTNFHLGGTLFGVERWLNETVMVGVLGGYANTSVGDHQAGSTAQINSYQVGLYELIRREELYFSNIDLFNDNQFDVSRPIAFGTIFRTASGKSNGAQWSHYSETGATIEFDELKLQPFVGLQYLYLDQGGVSENGAGSLSMNTSHQTVNSVRNTLGARIYHEFIWGNVPVIPSIAARYQHEWGNGTQLITSSLAGAPTAQFTTSGNHTGRNFGLVTLGATALLTDRFSVYTTLDTQFASSFFALVGSGGIQYSW